MFLNWSYKFSYLIKTLGNASVGTACVCPSHNFNKLRSICPLSSIFTAEIIAINDAVDFALKDKNHTYNIFSDSLSVILSLKNTHINIRINPYVFEIKEKIKLFQHDNHKGRIKLIWIPSHMGIYGNEEADRLAKLCTLQEPSN